ncbi:N-acetylglucosamine-6-phosphate deacetylase [uncultured Ferrimonas sp.]|uniref:N-acetylglucosamine-6-phosphate deacetylase n=1 Tax=uncultured Ferrimonas sp. TaxID=432640 RepID=UPI002624554C|nr:N-acetylglucosamine-6-phosphate deacetylase [uncultured Ferrimonas sp.]
MSQSFQLHVAQLFDGLRLHANVSVSVLDGRIHAITPCTSPEVTEGLLAPGYVDLQVNGGGDILFNEQPSVAAIEQMVRAHQRFGTTSLLPTVITDDIAVMEQAADAVAQALISQDSGVVGIHFEGPHIAKAKRGAHNHNHIRAISAAEWALFARTDLGCKLLTIAPEAVSPAEIERLVVLGVTVSLGHSNCSYSQAQQAIAAGASGVTHLFNAMSPLQGREPGLVGAALLSKTACAGIINDGHHVDFASVRLAYQALGAERLCLVTDAMPPVGGQQQQFTLVGNPVILNGDRLLGQGGELAGSVLTMERAVQLAVQQVGIEVANALQMATTTPARWLGLQGIGRIAVGQRADMVLLNKQLQLQRCWRAGRLL